MFDRWASMGVAHYTAMGIEPRVVRLKGREDAERDGVVSVLDDVGMAFFSGGNPRFLADTLRGSRFLARLLERLDDGLVYAGCSAGAMVASHDPTSRPRFGAAWAAGLGLVPGGAFGAHWNRVRAIPGLRSFVMSRAGEGWFAGIDERTAILGDGRSWRAYGSGTVALRRDGRTTTVRPGETFETG